jgi:hypothetical protein
VILKKGTFIKLCNNMMGRGFTFIDSEYDVEYEDKEVLSWGDCYYEYRYKQPYPKYNGRKVESIEWYDKPWSRLEKDIIYKQLNW